MKQLLLSLVIVIAFELLLSECANPKAPTGGPKDTIPPTLLEAFPAIESLNSNSQEITLTFDEWITAEKLTSNLIITPNIDIKYKTITRKNRLILKFEDPFPDSTTITFNFFDGITDITERTPAVNLIYVFSTGDYLDSLQISGNVYDLMKGTPKEKTIIGLYPYSDTLDIFTTKPTYFTSSDKEGNFQISNIKKATYKVLAFTDKNRNLTFDASLEPYGFLKDLIDLDSNIVDLSIPMIQEDASEFKMTTSRALGNYFDIQFTKGIANVEMTPYSSHSLSKDYRTIRIYKPENLNNMDSLETIITSYDSLLNKRIDTLFVKFNENTRKSEKFEHTFKPETQKIDLVTNYQLTFSKPIKTFDSTLLKFQKDSTITIPFDSTIQYLWNYNYTQLNFEHRFDTASYFQQQRLLFQAADTLLADTTSQTVNPMVEENEPEHKKPPLSITVTNQSINNSIDLIFPKGTFISIENDTLNQIEKSYSFLKKPEVGILFLSIVSEKQSYTVQVINKQFQVIREFEGQPQIRVNNLIPGEYGIRILIDDNLDGQWSKGNIRKNSEPESVYIYPEFTSIRANWEVTLDISF